MRVKRPAPTDHRDSAEIEAARRATATAGVAPRSTPAEALRLQREIGNRAFAGIVGASRPRPDATSSLQRLPKSEEAAREALKARAAGFHALGNANNTIVRPWDTDWPDPNCHGYTVHGTTDNFVEGDELLDRLEAKYPSGSVVVFVKGGQVAHSGRLNGDGTLTHLLIEVGLLTSNVGNSNAGYEARFTLPAGRGALKAYLQPRIVRQKKLAEIDRMSGHASAAINLELFRKDWGPDELDQLYNALRDLYDIVDVGGDAEPGNLECMSQYEDFMKGLGEDGRKALSESS